MALPIMILALVVPLAKYPLMYPSTVDVKRGFTMIFIDVTRDFTSSRLKEILPKSGTN
jgi:hypothetical protein